MTRKLMTGGHRLAATHAGRLVASIALLTLVSAGPASGGEPGPPPPPSPAAAEAALEAAADALSPDPAGAPDRGATLALAELATALPALDGADRRRARALLARPTDGAADPFGDGYGTDEEPPICSPHFCVHYVASTADAADPGYADEIAAIAEHSYGRQVDELGWAPPKGDRGYGGDSRIDIYLKELGRFGIFGYAATDPGQRERRQHGYLVIDNDFRPAQYRGFAEPLDAARVTVAHELSHLLQYAVTMGQDAWMLEATATWAEEKVYPEVDDYLRYVSYFARFPGAPITAFDAGAGLKPYGSAVWNHWLEARNGGYGPSVVRDAWEASDSTRPRDFAVHSYNRAIVRAGGAGFAPELIELAAATAEWRSGGDGLPDADRYPDMRREGRLGRGSPLRFNLDHTSYRLLRVPRLGVRRIRVVVRVPRGVAGGLALVTRRGGLVKGTALRRVRFMPRGGRRAIALRAPRRFNRITAVAVNADGRVRGRGARDWRYRSDGQAFRARLTARR